MDNALSVATQLKEQLPVLTVAVVGSWVWVSGPTVEYRAALRGHGLRWAPEKQKWYWKPAGHYFKGKPKEYSSIVMKYGERRIDSKPAQLALGVLVVLLSFAELPLQVPGPTKAPVCVEYCQ